MYVVLSDNQILIIRATTGLVELGNVSLTTIVARAIVKTRARIVAAQKGEIIRIPNAATDSVIWCSPAVMMSVLTRRIAGAREAAISASNQLTASNVSREVGVIFMITFAMLTVPSWSTSTATDSR